jgi:tripartite-type tricarboxylate transporter receptor subunit TctC
MAVGFSVEIGLKGWSAVQWTRVPYNGSAPALTALLGGHVHAVSCDTTWLPHVNAGTLRLLATHGENRMKMFPNIPTFKESGYDYVNENVFMMAAPKVFHRAMEDPEFTQTMARMELEVTYRNSEDTKKRIEEIFSRFKRIIEELKIPKGT